MAPDSKDAQLIPLFLGKRSRNITFVLDTSEAMSTVLGSVKRLLIQTLLTKASLRDSLFNIMTFSYKVSCWSHHMLPCAPDTVYESLSWIHSLGCSPGRDLLAALSTAFADPACHTAHLVTAGLPDHAEAVLRALPTVTAGRPVNVFYLSDASGQLDSKTRDFLQCLTHATRGSCYVIPIESDRALEKVIPFFIAESQTSVSSINSTVKSCSQNTPVIPHQHHVTFPLLRCSLGNPFCPVTSCVLSGRVLLGHADFLPGCRVLARRELDGLYYLGTVIQEVQGRRGVWVVEFDHPGSAGLGVSSSSQVTQQQLVCSPDMINHTKAHSRCLSPGDAVLSPWEPDLRRYGPGRVAAGIERRDSLKAACGVGLHVLMWNGCVAQVPGDLAVCIPASHHERIVRELQRATSAPSCHCNWPCVRTSSCCAPQPRCSQCCQSATTPGHCPVVQHRWPSIVPPTCACGLGKREGFEWVELEKKVDGLLEDLKDTAKSEPLEAPSSSSSSLSEDDTRMELSSPSGELRLEQERPPWRYWRRNPPEPQHRKPGNSVQRMSSEVSRFSYPVIQISALPNNSSMFQPLLGSVGERANIRDVLGLTRFRPKPPVGFQSLSGNAITTVST